MRRQAVSTFALAAVILAALLWAGMAAAAKPTIVRGGTLVVRLNGGVTPKRLPKRHRGPVALHIRGHVGTVDGSQPPVLNRAVIDFDRQGGINARGLTTCRAGQLQARDTRSARRVCRRAIVGKGSTSVRVEFAEQAPFTATGPLVLFNGGVHHGVTKLFIHAYVSVPAPTAVVTVVKIKHIHKGRYGTRAVARIPTIAGGSGTVTGFSMIISRNFRRHRKKQAYLVAQCRTGRLFAHAKLIFRGGTRLAGTVARPCRPRR